MLATRHAWLVGPTSKSWFVDFVMDGSGVSVKANIYRVVGVIAVGVLLLGQHQPTWMHTLLLHAMHVAKHACNQMQINTRLTVVHVLCGFP